MAINNQNQSIDELAIPKYNAADAWVRHYSAIRTSLPPALIALSILIGKERLSHRDWDLGIHWMFYASSLVAWLAAAWFFFAFTVYKAFEKEWKKKLGEFIKEPTGTLPDKETSVATSFFKDRAWRYLSLPRFRWTRECLWWSDFPSWCMIVATVIFLFACSWFWPGPSLLSKGEPRPALESQSRELKAAEAKAADLPTSGRETLLQNTPMVEFSENVLYYTFSTIAQTLAGAVAILAAFVLYRLSILNEEMGWNGGVLAEGINTDEARTLNGEGRYQELLDLATRANNAGRPIELRRLNMLVLFRRSLLRLFVFSISITAFVILASVLFIPFAPKQQRTDFIAWIAWLIIAGFGVCIVTYAILVWKSLQFVRQRPRKVGAEPTAPVDGARDAGS